jgi:hypothetical protein
VKDDSSDQIVCISSCLITGFVVVTPSFTHLSITFSNHRFSSCSVTMDVESVKLMSDSFCGNNHEDEYSVLLSSVR